MCFFCPQKLDNTFYIIFCRNIALKYLNAVGSKANAYDVLRQQMSGLNERERRRNGSEPIEGMPDIYYDLINIFE